MLENEEKSKESDSLYKEFIEYHADQKGKENLIQHLEKYNRIAIKDDGKEKKFDDRSRTTTDKIFLNETNKNYLDEETAESQPHQVNKGCTLLFVHCFQSSEK